MNVLDEFKNYKRKFIQISPRTAILLHIFSKDSDDFEDRDKCNKMLKEHEDKVQKLKPNKDNEEHI